ncbi:MAG: sulfatase-like hydrolase/transferase [Balneolaceae bacterium]|nr:sulfatase-like hydrolase/transferase [Balneolaceae bacterium]
MKKLLKNTGIAVFLCGVVLIGFLFSAAEPTQGEETPPPNIIFIFADDLGYYDVGAYGNSEVRTPNIDALAERGMKFTRAYNMGSWSPAVCIPSRTMLNTGRFLWDARKLSNTGFQEWHENDLFWSRQFKQAGYDTYFTGKWHVPGVNPQELFDYVVNIRPGMPNQTAEGYNRPHEDEEDPWSPYDPEFEGFWSSGTHWSEVLKNDATEFIEQAAGRKTPFFMYLAFNAPHDPRQAPREYVESYNPDGLEIPPNFLPVYPYKNPIGSGRVDDGNMPHSPGTPEEVIESSGYLRDEWLAPFPRTEYAMGVHRQEFYAIISHMDTQIGYILDSLDENGKTENTIIIFTADHGLAVGQHGLLGKQNMYEHSLRVPFILTGPGIPSGEVNESSIYLQDVVPTSIELAGGSVPDMYQFHSMIPLIRGEKTGHYPAIYGAYLQNQRAVVEWPYKLILYPDISRIRLYDLDKDPYEIHDLAENSASGPVIRRLMQRLLELQNDTGDELDLSGPFNEWF